MTEMSNKNSGSVAASGDKVSPSKGDSAQNDVKGGNSGAQKAGSDKAGDEKGKYQ